MFQGKKPAIPQTIYSFHWLKNLLWHFHLQHIDVARVDPCLTILFVIFCGRTLGDGKRASSPEIVLDFLQ